MQQVAERSVWRLLWKAETRQTAKSGVSCVWGDWLASVEVSGRGGGVVSSCRLHVCVFLPPSSRDLNKMEQTRVSAACSTVWKTISLPETHLGTIG